MKGSNFKSIQLLALIGILGLTAFSNAEQPKDELTKTRIVIRISREFIRKHALPPIEEMAPVDRCLFGAHVTGQSITKGQTTVNMDIEDPETVFTFYFTGTTVTNSVATHRPVAVYSTGTTDFVAERAIRFDGLRFTAEPAAIKATTSTTIDGIATPRGLIGRIAFRKACEAIDQNKSAADAISLQDTKTLVMASFNRQTELLVKSLNAVVPLQETVALVAPKTKDWITHISRTKEFIMISPGPKDADIPVLPKEYLTLKAPLELWIHGKPVGDAARGIVEKWATVNRTLDRFLALTTGTGKAAKVEALNFSAVGDWWVLKVGDDLLGPWVDKLEEKSKPKK